MLIVSSDLNINNNLQQHIRELEQDLMEALSQLDANVHALEEKDIQIDILENKIKQLHIDVSRYE